MSWSITPVIDWLMHKGRHLPTREEVVAEICERVRAAGMPIDRVAFFFWTLHPQYAGVAQPVEVFALPPGAANPG